MALRSSSLRRLRETARPSTPPRVSAPDAVLDVMITLAKEGMTMLVVTHEMGFARRAAHRVVFMSDGEIVEDAPPDTFFTQPRSDRAKDFLGKILTH